MFDKLASFFSSAIDHLNDWASSPTSAGSDVSSASTFDDGDGDWTNAWHTACDFQVPAESNSIDPCHDFTSTTFPDYSSCDSGGIDISSGASIHSSWD